jgi:RNA polymerase sigma-70 factor (ECF subfamily)
MKEKNKQEKRIASDKQLAAKMQTGTNVEKETAFNEIFKIHKVFVLNKLMLAVNLNAMIAEDLLMEVFTKVYININKYNPSQGALSTWIGKITINHLIDYKRTHKGTTLSLDQLETEDKNDDGNEHYTYHQTVDQSNSSFEILVKKEQAATLKKAIELIKNDAMREIIIMRIYSEASYEEIADKLNIPIGSVKAYINRAKSEMSKFLSKKEFEQA